MKNLLLILIAIISIFSCKDNKIEPANSIKLNDLLGTWVSVDSFLTRDSSGGEYYYTREIIEIDTTTLPQHYKPYIALKPYCVRKVRYGIGYYSINVANDSMHLKYMGPGWIEIDPKSFKIILSENKDTINLRNIKDFVPNGLFDKFYKE